MCWGRNDSGELGGGTTMGSAAPVFIMSADVVSAGGTADLFHGAARELAAGDGAGRTCAIVDVRTRGAVYCWGDDQNGAVGDGNTDDVSVPVLIGEGHDEVVPGGSFTCAITVDDEIHRWGDNDSGELGRQGPSSSRPQPATVLFGAEPT